MKGLWRLACAGALVAALATRAAPAIRAADAIDDYLRAEMTRRSVPGLALAVARDGQVADVRHYGLAHIETGSPVGADSIFAIASLDKQLTAAGVLEAAELGKLGIDDPLAKWVETPFAGVTLRHLLQHTSGLPDEVAGAIEGRSFTDYTTEQLLATVRGLAPLAPPGARFLYSDAGLFLAQLATEKAVGEPWWDFMRRALFVPAGMTSVASMAPAALLSGRVSAYSLREGGDDGEVVRDRRLDVDYGPLYTDLGMTVADFARWLAALDTGRPLGPESVAEMTTAVRLGDGSAAGEVFQWSRYGLGVGLDDLLGEPVVLHSGHSGVGFVRVPRRRLSVVVFTNLEHPAGSDPVGLAIGVAGLLEPRLSLASQPVRGAATPVHLAAEAQRLLAGEPDLDLYAPRFRAAVWDGAPTLAGRAARLGRLVRCEAIISSPVDDEPTEMFRAVHEHGILYLRFSLDEAGKVNRLVWWHV